MSSYVFLDPDGSQEWGLVVIVAAATGVTYAHQCGGHATELREVEGFAVPLGGPSAAKKIVQWFAATFGGNPPLRESRFWRDWSQERIEELASIVSDVPFWLTPGADGPDQRCWLKLDRDRFGEVTEAWVPVRTPYGPGVLLFQNSD